MRNVIPLLALLAGCPKSQPSTTDTEPTEAPTAQTDEVSPPVDEAATDPPVTRAEGMLPEDAEACAAAGFPPDTCNQFWEDARARGPEVDTDESGDVSKAELMTVVEVEPDSEEADAIWADTLDESDKDGDGSLSLEEYTRVAFLLHVRAAAEAQVENVEPMEEVEELAPMGEEEVEASTEESEDATDSEE